MLLYNLLSIFSAAAAGLGAFMTFLHTRMFLVKRGYGRRIEGAFALVKAGWSLTAGTILYILIWETHASQTPFRVSTLAYLIGLGISSVGMMLLLRTTVDRYVHSERQERLARHPQELRGEETLEERHDGGA